MTLKLACVIVSVAFAWSGLGCSRPHVTSSGVGGAMSSTSTSTSTSTPTSTPMPTATATDSLEAKSPAAVERGNWRARLGWDEDCEHYAGGPDSGISVFVISPTRSLVRVICSLGAYQGEARIYVWNTPGDGGAPHGKLMSFPVPDSNQKGHIENTPALSNFADWNEEKKELRVWRRYRGPGDCGSLVRYTFDGDRVVVKEMRQQIECNGKNVDPDKWPLVPRAK